jgi:hypothetical protein
VAGFTTYGERLRTTLNRLAGSERIAIAAAKGILGNGVASCTLPDPQARGLGEYLRSRAVDVPRSLLPDLDPRCDRG